MDDMPKKSVLPETIYYTDLLNDEFSPTQIEPISIDKDYRYLHDDPWGKFLHFLYYRVIGKPIAWLYLKLKFHHKIHGKRKLKPFKHDAIFIYGNHTQDIGDALMPAFILSPRNINVIVHPNNVSIKGLGHMIRYVGALPLPGDVGASKNFNDAINKRVQGKQAIVIYPEAHIWPYYTHIRPFVDASFSYPVRYEAPTFCFTNTYRRRGKSKKVDIVTYIDGPFYPKDGLDLAESKKNLRDQVYAAMVERSYESNFEKIRYKKKKEEGK